MKELMSTKKRSDADDGEAENSGQAFQKDVDELYGVAEDEDEEEPQDD